MNWEAVNQREQEVVAAWKDRPGDRDFAGNCPCYHCVSRYIYGWGGTLGGIQPGAAWWDQGDMAYPLCETHYKEFREAEQQKFRAARIERNRQKAARRQKEAVA